MYQFVLAAERLENGAGGVTLTITDAAGKVVLTIDADAGEPAVTRVGVPRRGNVHPHLHLPHCGGQAAAPILYACGCGPERGRGHLSAATTRLDDPPTDSAPSPTTTTPTTPSPPRRHRHPYRDAYTGVTRVPRPTPPTTSMWSGMWYFF